MGNWKNHSRHDRCNSKNVFVNLLNLFMYVNCSDVAINAFLSKNFANYFMWWYIMTEQYIVPAVIFRCIIFRSLDRSSTNFSNKFSRKERLFIWEVLICFLNPMLWFYLVSTQTQFHCYAGSSPSQHARIYNGENSFIVSGEN